MSTTDEDYPIRAYVNTGIPYKSDTPEYRHEYYMKRQRAYQSKYYKQKAQKQQQQVI